MTFNTTVHQECHFGVHMAIFVILNCGVPRTAHPRTRTLKDQDMEGSQTFFWNKKTSAPAIRCTVRRRQTWRNSCRAHDKWHLIPHTIAKQKNQGRPDLRLRDTVLHWLFCLLSTDIIVLRPTGVVCRHGLGPRDSGVKNENYRQTWPHNFFNCRSQGPLFLDPPTLAQPILQTLD